MSKKSKNKCSNSDSTSDLQLLFKKREVVKNKQSSFKLQIELFRSLLETEEINNIDDRKITELELRYERQINLLKEFEDIQLPIECLRENDEEQLEEREVFENEFYELISSCKKIINDYYSIKNGNTLLPNVKGSASQINSNFDSQNIKLPQIQLPKFSGSYDNWLEFRDTFDSLINGNTAITPIQKFHYLRAALEGGAAQVIRSLEFSAANYSVAWNTLLSRYNNDSLLVSNHIKSIFNIPVLQTESAFDLRKMLDVLSKHLQSLQSLGQPVQYWDTLIIHILSGKLDKTTSREWEEGKVKNFKSGSSQLPTLEDFKIFLKNKADLLENLSISKCDRVSDTNLKKNKLAVHSSFQNNNKSSVSCVFCREKNHHIQNCPKFVKLSVSDRIENTKRLKLCINCLRGNHLQKYCYAGHCKKCPAKHNTLLHLESNRVEQRSTLVPESNNPNLNNLDNANSSNSANYSNSVSYQIPNNYTVSTNVLLSTAVVLVKDSSGSYHPCRVLLDSGSQSHFVSEQLCNRLRIKRNKINMSVTGINQVNSIIDYQCSVTIESLSNSWIADIVCLIVPVINNGLPDRSLDVSPLNIPPNIKLADPSFSESGPIDLLIGAGLFYDLLCIGQISLGQGLPILQKTVLGWIVSGTVNTGEISTTTNCNQLVTNKELHEMMQRFWLVEEPCIKKPILSKEENLCEEIFQKTTTRDFEGRFVVEIPLKDSPTVLGDSKQNAYKRLKALESKLCKNPNFSKLYSDFLQEYSQLNHMSIVEIDSSKKNFFLPHHGILKENNHTTKLRVVFDASARTDSGVSLNDIQLVGPTIQNDLVSILMRFRRHAIVVCADIVKMYRQILVCPE